MENCTPRFLWEKKKRKKRPTRGRVKIVLGEAADIPPRSRTPVKVFHNNAELVVCYLPPTQLIKTYLSTPFLNNAAPQLGTEEETEAFKAQVSTPFVRAFSP